MYGAVIAVGPEDRAEPRLQALISELGHHEARDELHLLVIDDAPRPRRLAVDWPSFEVVRTSIWERGRPDVFSAQVAGTLGALGRAGGLEFVVKLDTDAAVIGPFAEAIRAAFGDPSLGVVGSYDWMSTGALRDWAVWRPAIDRADRRIAVLRRGGGQIRLHHRRRRDRELVGRVRERAYRFAPPGAHCLGGAYAVSAAFLNTAALDWRPWIRTRLSEDVVVGLLSSAAHLRMRSLTGAGQPFALAWRGLPAPPAQLVASGHSIVHSVKCPTEAQERELRECLQRLACARLGSVGPGAGLSGQPVGHEGHEGDHEAELAERVGPRPAGKMGELPGQRPGQDERDRGHVHPAGKPVDSDRQS